MPSFRNLISKPEYLLRPSQVARRLCRIGKPVPPTATVRLPWGALVTVQTHENVGCEIYHHGIFDKIIPEAIWRLLDPTETAIEIGANIGQNSSIMAARAGQNGRVIAFEPHPEIFEELGKNHEQSKRQDFAPVQLERVALGETTGEALLVEMNEFSHNRGSARLQSKGETTKGVPVPVRRLDEFLEDANSVGVCKIDVEGHEFGVLKGAEHALHRRIIRDIIFEDFNPQPSKATQLLQQYGFTIFELYDTWLKPKIRPLVLNRAPRPGFSWNYLATLNPARATRRFRPPGWRCLLSL